MWEDARENADRALRRLTQWRAGCEAPARGTLHPMLKIRHHPHKYRSGHRETRQSI